MPVPTEAEASQEQPAHPVIDMQRTFGNRATNRMIRDQVDAAASVSALDTAGPTLFRAPNHPTHPESEHQDPYARRHRHPDDEQRLNWNDSVRLRPPSDPYVVLSLDPGLTCPFPPHAVVEQEPTHHSKDESTSFDPFKQQHSDDTIVQKWWLGQRQVAWDAYRAAAAQVQAKQEEVAPDINLFFHAEKNEELRALDFIMPKGYKGTLLDLSEMQQVPTRGGPKVGSLFRGDGSLNTTKADEKAIDSSAAAMDHGKGGIQDSFRATATADSELQGQISMVKAAIETVKKDSFTLKAANEAIEFAKAEDEAGEAKEEIERLKQETETVASIIEFIVAAPEKLASLAEEGVNKLEAVGTVATLMLKIFPSDEMQRATAKLAKAQATMKTAKAAELQAKLEAAKAGMAASIDALAGQKKLLAAKLMARRQAYSAAGVAAGGAATGSSQSQQKIAGIVAAIPIVESVIASLRNITAKTSKVRPPYSPEAGLGYGIAISHQNSAAFDLPNAIGVLEYSNTWFGTVQGEWQERLKSLNATKERIGGTRPGE
jgi:hypothetical protein